MTQIAETKAQPSLQDGRAPDIRTVIARRTDLSSFLVHLTRDADETSAKDVLRSIVSSWTVEAKTVFGWAKKVENNSVLQGSRRCVCFTETPLEYLYLLTGKIKGRKYNFAKYGVAITKCIGRKRSANPLWYINMTGDRVVGEAIDTLVKEAIESGHFEDSAIAKILPFVEQMGDWRSYGGPERNSGGSVSGDTWAISVSQSASS